MIRGYSQQCGVVAGSTMAAGSSPSLVKVASTRSHVQRPDLTTLTHGAGLQSMEPGFNNPFSRYKPSAPAADFFTNAAGRGQGTSEKDPYVHTLPNMPLKDPTSSVLSSDSHGASHTLHLTKDDVDQLPSSTRKIAAWLEETSYSEGTQSRASPTNVTHTTLLGLYINEHLKIDLPLPKHADAEKRMKAFTTEGIKEVCMAIGNPSVDVACASWKKATDAFSKVSLNLFDPNAFLKDIAKCRDGCVKVAHEIMNSAAGSDGAGGATTDDEVPEEFIDIIDVITRAVLDRRNSLVDEHIMQPCCGGSDAESRAALRNVLDGGNGVWKCLLAHIEANHDKILGSDEVLLTKLEWMKNHGRAAPAVTPAVAIYLILSAISLSSAAPVPAVASGSLADVRNHSMTLESVNPLYGISMEKRREFVISSTDALCSDYNSAKILKKALEKAGLREMASAVEMVATSAHMSGDILRREVGHLANLLKDEDAARAFCVTVTEHVKTEQDLASTFTTAFGLSNIDHFRVLPDKGWAGYHAEFCEILFRVDELALRNEDTSKLVKESAQAINSYLRVVASKEEATDADAASKIKMPAAYNLPNSSSILNDAVKTALMGIVSQRQSRKAEQRRIRSTIDQNLRSPSTLDATLEILEDCGIDVVGKLHAMTKTPSTEGAPHVPEITGEVLRQSLHQVSRENMNWVNQGIVADEAPTPEDPKGSLTIMGNALNILLRLNYVPQSSQAMLKRNLRGRLGEVSSESKHQNVPVEVGQSEVYDVQQYKRYDPQGWYQRMQDIHHRNVSIKMRLSDLRVLNHDGTAPYGNMQTERRLRVVAGDKVGMDNIMLDSDRFEDRVDNQNYGTMKLQEVLAESRKATLGPEFWPTVEVKVRNPSGQTRAMQSLIDYGRIESTSADLYKKYRELKAKTLFVSPTQLYIHGNNSGDEVKAEAEGASQEAKKRDAQRGFLDNEFSS